MRQRGPYLDIDFFRKRFLKVPLTYLLTSFFVLYFH